MKVISIIVMAAALAIVAPARAQPPLDLSTITCKQFQSLDRETISLILMWMTGYYADQDAPPIIDFAKLKENAEKLGKYCSTNPTHSLITGAQETFEEQ